MTIFLRLTIIWWYYVSHGMWWWFYLKMWMNTHIQWKYVECLPVENESTPRVMTVWHNVCRTLSCVHRKKLFEFLKYNNICSLTAILNESISKLCGLSTKYAHIWGTVKITHCHMHSSTESFNEWRFTNQNTLKKYSQKKE